MPETEEGKHVAGCRETLWKVAKSTGGSASRRRLTDLGEHVIVEAEKFAAQGGGQIKIYAPESVRGQAITYWHRDIGHWLEWTVSIPKIGRYAVFARYATGSHNTPRDFHLDGKSPAAELVSVASFAIWRTSRAEAEGSVLVGSASSTGPMTCGTG